MFPAAVADEGHWESEREAGGGVSLMDWHAADLEDRNAWRILKNILVVFCVPGRTKRAACDANCPP